MLIGGELAPQHVAPGDESPVHDQQDAANGHRGVDVRKRNLRDRRQLEQGALHVKPAVPDHEAEEGQQQHGDHGAHDNATAAGQGVLQVLYRDVPAVAQHQARAQERQPDHHVARHFLSPFQ